ncbi:fungal-specific transcription factor domain-containing protein [Whalleya microplaca]|nr:fungal-specific transcription factor domain-containing protein [Whalleya microplaca]
MSPSAFLDDLILPTSTSQLALPAEESYFMQHYLQNVARVALAVDYDQNGYRSLLPLAYNEPAVLNAALAVAASHYSRWQHTRDDVSRKYLRAAAKSLRDRCSKPELINTPATLASMLLLVTFEVFSGTSRWKGHYDAIRGWVRSRGDCSDLDPFLKTWICLIDTQCALNMGLPVMTELQSWIESGKIGEKDEIDALFGCSARLPRLMWAASQLSVASKVLGHDPGVIRKEAEALQEKIRETAISPESEPSLGILCRNSAQSYSAKVGLEDEELRRRMVAVAEIFRYACHIYVYRVVHAPQVPLTEEMESYLQNALQLLTLVPDALGPGANLGWCLVVLGAEVDVAHQRDYIRSRWAGLDLTGIYNAKSGAKILDEVWGQRDLVRQGHAIPERWQDIMQRIGQSQILV